MIYAALADALAAQGLPPGAWAVYWCVGEGHYCVVGGVRLEEHSGHLVTRGGHHYAWWLGGADGRPVLRLWRPEAMPAEMSTDWAYNQARLAVGLPVVRLARALAVAQEGT